MSSSLINRFYSEVLSGGNLALVDEMVTDDFLDHELALPGQPPGKEGAKFLRECDPIRISRYLGQDGRTNPVRR